MFKKRWIRPLLILAIILGMVVFFSQCMDFLKSDIRGKAYAGEKSCIQCHKDIYNSFAHNVHRNTSSIIGKDFLDSLNADSNEFYYTDEAKVTVEKRHNGVFQIASVDGRIVDEQKFDVAFGSGEKAQTYAYWKGNKLYQLPLSYFKVQHAWMNSPGFPSNQIHYDRAILSRCLECHGSFIEKKIVANGSLAVEEQLNKGAVLYGIDCERCHGPAANHVAYHQQFPQEKVAKYMVTYSSLNKRQKLDMCGVCHSGNDQLTHKTTFAFKPGDTLAKFLIPSFGINPKEEIDVHGKQNQMLMASACYINSSALDCVSCHNSHESQSQTLMAYSQKCISCHEGTIHSETTLDKTNGISLKENCIDCHMPAQPSKAITFYAGNKKETVPYYLRTHRIAIYKTE
jgi:predicted CXXCH cytochrome family protein